MLAGISGATPCRQSVDRAGARKHERPEQLLSQRIRVRVRCVRYPGLNSLTHLGQRHVTLRVRALQAA
jgi:hypothetical protein